MIFRRGVGAVVLKIHLWGSSCVGALCPGISIKAGVNARLFSFSKRFLYQHSLSLYACFLAGPCEDFLKGYCTNGNEGNKFSIIIKRLPNNITTVEHDSEISRFWLS